MCGINVNFVITSSNELKRWSTESAVSVFCRLVNTQFSQYVVIVTKKTGINSK